MPSPAISPTYRCRRARRRDLEIPIWRAPLRSIRSGRHPLFHGATCAEKSRSSRVWQFSSVASHKSDDQPGLIAGAPLLEPNESGSRMFV
jgi:hypothetical protein